MSRPAPPRLASAILARLAPRAWREPMAGDLEEEFAHRARASVFRARWWYRHQVLRVALSRRPAGAPAPASSRAGMTRRQGDIRAALRALRRQPRFALLFIVVLGVSLGTSGVVFGIVDAYLLRPLPYPAAERLVRYTRTAASREVTAPRDLEALGRDRLLGSVADLVIAADFDGFILIDGATPRTLLAAWITADVFPLFGIRPALGRAFTPDEVAAGSPVVLISHATWLERYGGDPGVIGRSLTIRSVEPPETRVFTVIGVLPPRFWHLDDRTAVLAPLHRSGDVDVIAFRLREGLTIEEAASRLTAEVAAANPSMDSRWRVDLTSLQAEHVEPVRELLHAVTLAVALMMLIAAANLAMLQGVRALARQPEIAIRTALGAGRARLAGQLLVEHLVLAGAACLLGWGLVQVFGHGVVSAVEAYVGRLVPTGSSAILSARVFVVQAVLLLLPALAIGVWPGLRPAPALDALRTSGRGTDTRRHVRVRHALVILQVAATLALLVGATLLMRTAWRLSHTPLGFDTAQVLNASIVMEAPRYPDADRREQAVSRLVTALQALPEVDAAAVISARSFGGFAYPRAVLSRDADAAAAPRASVIGVTPTYFRALRLPIREGRPLSDADMAGDGRVAVISASLARALWPSSAAIGQTITTTGLRPMLGGVEVGSEADAIAPFQVVGVAGDVRRSLVRSAVHEIYIPLVDIPSPTLTLQVRGREPIGPRMLSAAVTRAIRAVDPELPLDDVGMLDDIVARAGVRPRFLAALLGGFSAIAAVGALIGLYATSAWVARQRRREAAIRLALGAAPHQIVRTFTAHGAGAVAAGLAVGWWASLGLGRLLSRELTGVNADDPTTRIALAAALCVCCVLAIYRPARAVARMSPASTLRE